MSARKSHPSLIREYINPLVIFAYVLLILATLIAIYALRVVPLSYFPILEASGHIFITVMCFCFLKEKIPKKKLLGFLVIIIGIAVFAIF
jgi:multidrug transporter EmrE-like cation transporter